MTTPPEPAPAPSSMSKKTAIAGMAITAIAASTDWHAQAIIAAVATIAIIAQATLDWHADAPPSSARTGGTPAAPSPEPERSNT